MSPIIASIITLVALCLAILVGHQIRRTLPDRRLNDETKDTVKLSMGLVGTLTALLLGLLISSAKNSYDTQRSQVTQMVAKVAVLNRVLALYGDETLPARKLFRLAIEDAIRRLWPKDRNASAQLQPNTQVADSVYFEIEALTPANDRQQKLKAIAETNAVDIAQQRALLVAQSERSVSAPMLLVLASWLIIIFASFSLLAPPNLMANLALVISSIAVAGAIFLLLELDQPFDGLLRIPNREMVNAWQQLPQ